MREKYSFCSVAVKCAGTHCTHWYGWVCYSAAKLWLRKSFNFGLVLECEICFCYMTWCSISWRVFLLASMFTAADQWWCRLICNAVACEASTNTGRSEHSVCCSWWQIRITSTWICIHTVIGSRPSTQTGNSESSFIQDYFIRLSRRN